MGYSNSKRIKNDWRKACISPKEIKTTRIVYEEEGDKMVQKTKKVTLIRHKGKATTSLRMWVRNRVRDTSDFVEKARLENWCAAKGIKL